MIIKSLSQFYRMNEQRLGIELPIGSRGMGESVREPLLIIQKSYNLKV